MRGLKLAPAAALLLGAWSCQTAPVRTPEALPAVDASVDRAEVIEVASAFETGGVVRAKTTAAISARILAPVVKVLVAPGDRVRRGQTLVLLDDRDLRAQQSRATSGVVAGEQSLAAARADEQAASAGLQLARATHRRIDALAARKSATAQELDEAVAGLRSAEGRAAGASARVAEAEAGLQAARAAADSTQVTASYAVITAPFDGVVSTKPIEAGNLAAPGTPLLTVEDTSAFRLELKVDEGRTAQLAAGQNVAVAIDRTAGDPARTLAGHIDEISRAADAAGHTFVVKVALPADASLRSGLFGRARFSGPARRALTAPASAIVRRGQLTLVYAIDAEGRARLRPVAIGTEAGDRVEVLAGLDAGDRVVLDPPARLVDGSPVKSLVAQAAGQAGTAR